MKNPIYYLIYLINGTFSDCKLPANVLEYLQHISMEVE
jgi:hypothetical protein